MYKVSVVIPIYNVEKYIERCARSLFEQTLDDVEYIFVDDCSPDQSVPILQRTLQDYPGRKESVRIIRHKENKGVAAARNAGINAAQGEYIIHCDSDDWVDANMYELMYRKAQETNADIVICDWRKVYTNKSVDCHVNPPLSPKECAIQILNGKMHGGVWNKLVKRELYTKYHIRCIEGANYCEDLYIACRLFYHAQSVAYIGKPLYNYYKGNENSYTRKRLSESSQRGLVSICKELRAYFANDKQLQEAMNYYIVGVKTDLIVKGNVNFVKELNKTGVKTIIYHPTQPLKRKVLLVLNELGLSFGVKIFRCIYDFRYS